MSANLFGTHFQVMSFGESHGPGLGVVIDGCPSGVIWREDVLLKALQRRRPGQASWTTARNESDQVEVLSGVYEGKTLGTPIAMIVRNQDARSTDYQMVAQSPRVGHADDTWKAKFDHVDHRGGGRSSGRETVARVMAGAVAQMLAQQVIPELRVAAWATQIGPHAIDGSKLQDLKSRFIAGSFSIDDVDSFAARFPDEKMAVAVAETLVQAVKEGQSFGGRCQLLIQAAPKGLGEPVFHKLKADLAGALMGIGAVNGIEFGAGFSASRQSGTEFHRQTQDYGGIRGGISTGETIEISLSFKPTSSIMDVAKVGRHDPCIVPRAIPVCESMVWIVLADHILWQRLNRV